VEPAELLDRGALPGGGGPGDDQPASGADLALVQRVSSRPSLVISVMVEVVTTTKSAWWAMRASA
jgi:hypothetical protein